MAREVPQYISQLNMGSMPKIQPSMAGAEATQHASKELSDLATDISNKDMELQELKAKSDVELKFNEIYLRNQDNPLAIKQEMDGFKKGYLGGLPPGLREKFEATYDVTGMPFINKATLQKQKNVSEQLKQQRIHTIFSNTDSIRLIAPGLYDPRPEIRKESGQALQLKMQEINSALEAKEQDGSLSFDPVTIEKVKRATKDAAGQQAVLAWYDTQPDKVKALQDWASGGVEFSLPNEGAPVIGKAEEAINYVIDNFEINPRNPDQIVKDGKGKAKYGINNAANPGVNIDSLTREDAVKIYKSEYWDKINANALPENVRLIAYDTAVNFGVPATKKMLAEAGNDPRKLAQLRKEKHASLIESDPEQYGMNEKSWVRRDEHFAKIAGDELSVNPRQFMSTDGLESLDKEIAGLTRQHVAEVKRIKEEQQKQMEHDAGMAMISDALSGKIVIDPANKDVEKYLNLTVNSNPNITLEEMRHAAEAVGVVPERLKFQLSGFLLNGSPKQQVAAADMAVQMMESKPNLDTGLNPAAKTKATMIGLSVSAGVDPESAVAMADEAAKPQNESTIAYRKKQIEGTANPFKFAQVESKFNHYFAADPNMPDAMKAEYETVARDYYTLYGADVESSKALALQNIRSKWAETRVDGKKRMMKYSPEALYAVPGVDNSWMREQLLSDVGSIPTLYNNDKERTKRLDSIIIQPNPRTISTANVLYDVFDVKEDGTIEKIFGADGRPVLFKPDFSKSAKGKEMLSTLKDPAQYIKEARDKQTLLDNAPDSPMADAFSRAKIGAGQ